MSQNKKSSFEADEIVKCLHVRVCDNNDGSLHVKLHNIGALSEREDKQKSAYMIFALKKGTNKR